MGFPGGSDGKESACDAGGLGLIPGWGRSPGEGNGYPLQYSCLENSMYRGAWEAIVHGVASQICNYTFIGFMETIVIIPLLFAFGIKNSTVRVHRDI